MFAYCGNNPVVLVDPSGNYCVMYHTGQSAFDAMNGIVDAGGGGGQVGPPGWNPGVNIPKLNLNAIDDAIDYITNTDEQVALDAKYFAFYKGQLVIKEDWGFTNGRSGSFIIMFLNSNETDPNVVKHEWGHFAQLMIMGLPDFALSVAIPSVLSDPYDPYYYSNPWERTADWLGGVEREGGYITGSLAWGIYQFVAGPSSVPAYLIYGG